MRLSLLIACLLALAARAAAQTTSTEILGTVTDATGAVVPGAKVTLLRTATGERRETVTTSTGDYSFPLIDIGDYTITVRAEGFKTAEKKDVLVQLQQKARVDFRIEVGQATETVEVVASAVTLKTDDAAVGQVIDNKRVVELPLNGRNVAGLAVLTPGVQFGVRMGLDGLGSGGFPIPGALVAVSANGQREVNQQITLDGVIATEPRTNTLVFTPSIDAIEEFKVQTSSYSAEYGQNNGAIVQIALKSGANQLRGTVYEFLRNDALDAKDYFLNFQLPPGAAQQQKNRLRRNQFGAFVSGPVELPKLYNGRDRTFWSFNYEGRRETQESVQEAFWFPQSFRNGDFSALLTPLVQNGKAVRAPIIIYDPLTGEPFRDGQGRVTNIIPPSRINKNAQAFINQYQPLPMFQPADILDINARSSVPNVIDANQYFFRVDHQVTSKDKVFVRFATDHSSFDNNVINPNFPTFTTSVADNVAVQYLHIFSPTMLNEFRYGLNKADDQFLNPRTNTNFNLDSLGIGKFRVATDGNRTLTPRETGIPTTLIGGDRDLGNGYDFNTVHQFADNLSITRGSHNFKTGFEYRRVMLDRAGGNLKRGSVGCCEGGYNLAGWLLGYPSASTTGEGSASMAARQNRWSAYFLDDWKITRKLTVNLGLRWDFFQNPYDSNGGWRSLRLDVLSQAADGRMLPTLIPAPNTTTTFYNAEDRFFMPRIGLAYRATDKWVIRSGFGWFANAQQINNFSILILNPPKSGSFTFSQVTDTAQVIPYLYNGQNYNIQTRKFRPGSTVLTLDNLFPSATNAPSRTNLILMPPDNKSSDVVQWSLDIQRSLPWQTQLTVAYVGSKTSHLDNSIANFNSPPPSTDTNFNSRRPFQAYISEGQGNQALGLGNIRYLDSYGNGFYHGLQTSVEKRYSAGLTMGLAYTYSKALGEGYGRNESGDGIGNGQQDPHNRRASRSRFGFDVTHNAVFNFVYEPPFLKRFRGVTGAILGGWQTNGILTLRTGFPFNLNGGSLNTGADDSRPDRIADGRLGSDATRQRWFDPTAFRRNDCNIPNRPDLCHYGTSGYGVLTTPGARDFDLSVYKNWRITPLGEAGRLQFRTELFNAFNTPQFGQPNGISFTSIDSIVPDGPRDAEIRKLRLPMRIIQMGVKLYF